MKVSGYDRGLDLLRRLILLVAALTCYAYGSLVWVYLGVLVPAVYVTYILGSMTLFLLAAVTKLKPVYPTLRSRRLQSMCPICGVNKLGIYRNRCKVCGREVCYRCLHPQLKWLCTECGTCIICQDAPGYVQCKSCGHRVCFHCIDEGRICILCTEKTDMSRVARARLVVLSTTLHISQTALNCLQEAIREDLLNRNLVLWKGSSLTSLGARFEVRGTLPCCRVRIQPSTKIVAKVLPHRTEP